MPQARGPEGPKAVIKDRPGTRERHNLPVHRTGLIGRDHDAAVVCQAVLESEGHLVTLTGAGGCGKTRLALQVGRDLVDAFDDGVWLAELAPLADESLVAQAVAWAVGVTEQPDRSLLDTLVASLQPRQLLLVLDNCEHLIRICAHLAHQLLAACPGLRIMATSRQPLRLASEVAWPVPLLALPDVRRLPADPEAVARYPAVQLFIERARAAQPAFGLTRSNAAAVAQICVRLHGLPLALELAAARIRALTAEQIAARLDAMFRVLAEGDPTAPSRQQTLRATLDWSEAMLRPAERAVFRRIAVFAGGWTLEAAEAVCAGEGVEPGEILGLLARLVDRSLVVAEPRGPHRAEMRYVLLEPVRQYAWEHLMASGEAGAAGRRHIAYYVALAKPGQEGWRGREEVAWLDSIEPERGNLQAALRRSLDDGDIDSQLLLCVRLTRFWEVRGSMEEGERWLEEGLARAAGVSAALRMRAVGRAAHVAAHRGDVERVGTLSHAWLSLAREVGDEVAAVDATFHRAGYLWAQGNLDEAVRLYESGLTFWRTRGDSVPVDGHPFSAAVHLGAHLYNVGWLLVQRGELERARGCLVEVVSLAESMVDAVQESMGLAGLGLIAYTVGDVPEAGRLVRRALRVVAELGHQGFMGMFLDILAHIAAAQDEVDRAGRLFGVAEAEREALPRRLDYHDLVLGTGHARQVAALRSGPQAARFSAAWTQGRALSLEEAVVYALADGEPATATARRKPPLARPRGRLTPREQEVAALVARGLSNREIAAQLVITERTAGAHVEHLLDKLGFASRTQIGVWAAEHGLVASGPS
jgi:non-specific serine/threonine protein kinase